MRLVFFDATQGFTPDRKDKKPCGGILTSLSIIPKYLASKGFDVTVKSSYEEECEIDGVKYIPLDSETLIPKWDISILNRNGVTNQLVEYSHKIGAKVIWWLHDIVDFRYLNDASYRRVDKIIALSQYCKQSFSDFYDTPKDKFIVIPNGVDKSVFYPGDYSAKKKYKMIMAGALIKGFTPIYDTWNNVKRQFPDATLTIYSNQNLHGAENSPIQDAFLTEMEGLGCQIQNPIPQNILADKIRESWAVLMPNNYPEICSNMLLQTKACGTPVITSNIGSASEFIKNQYDSIITPYAPHDLHLWIKKYAESVVRLFSDDKTHKAMSTNASKDIASWDDIGECWYETIQGAI